MYRLQFLLHILYTVELGTLYHNIRWSVVLHFNYHSPNYRTIRLSL